jgi:hypothetical protein
MAPMSLHAWLGILVTVTVFAVFLARRNVPAVLFPLAVAPAAAGGFSPRPFGL